DYADVQKAVALLDSSHFMFPVEHNRSGSDPFRSCTAPSEYVEIGLDGQISACCRSQDVSLGYATSIDKFCDVWFGKNYDTIRRSLRRGETSQYPLPNCLSCVRFFAPSEAGNRGAVQYSQPELGDLVGSNRLHLDEEDSLSIEVIQKEEGFCHVAAFPLGIRAGAFELWEDQHPLGPGGC